MIEEGVVTVVCGASMAAMVMARRNCTLLCCTQSIMAALTEHVEAGEALEHKQSPLCARPTAWRNVREEARQRNVLKGAY